MASGLSSLPVLPARATLLGARRGGSGERSQKEGLAILGSSGLWAGGHPAAALAPFSPPLPPRLPQAQATPSLTVHFSPHDSASSPLGIQLAKADC